MHIMCAQSPYSHILTSSSFVSSRTEEEDVHELARLEANASAVALRARAEAELVLRLDDAAEEAKENEGEYINITCSFMFNLLCIFTNIFFFHYFHTYQHLTRKLVKQS